MEQSGDTFGSGGPGRPGCSAESIHGQAAAQERAGPVFEAAHLQEHPEGPGEEEEEKVSDLASP